jgi:hypothetical protein
MAMKTCNDPVVGDILSSWRYDISGIVPEMRTDYEEHLATCPFCRSRQRLHRAIDMVLIGVTTLSSVLFVLALAVIHKVEPLRTFALFIFHIQHIAVVLTLQVVALVGLLVSLLAWVLVAVATPAPMYLTGVALAQARVLQARLPEEWRSRFQRGAF